MADLTTERLGPAAGVTAIEGKHPQRDQGSGSRRRPPQPPPPEPDTTDAPEEPPHTLDRMA